MPTTKDKVIENYKNSGILVRGFDFQTPITVDDINSQLSTMAINDKKNPFLEKYHLPQPVKNIKPFRIFTK